MQKRTFDFIQLLHSIVGTLSLILIILLVLTGVLLNHRDDLTLHEKYPTNPLVLWLYGSQEKVETDEDFIDTPPTWEKVITALHGGRFFGTHVPFFIDFMGALIFFQSITGLYIWLKKLMGNKNP